MPFYKKVVFIIAIVFFVVMGVNALRRTLLFISNSKRLGDLELEVSNLRQQKGEISESLMYRQTNEYIEERARNDLNMIQPGEDVFVPAEDDQTNQKRQELLVSLDEQGDIQEDMEEQDETANWNIVLWYKVFF